MSNTKLTQPKATLSLTQTNLSWLKLIQTNLAYPKLTQASEAWHQKNPAWDEAKPNPN